MMTGRASWIAVVIAVGITACSNPVTSRRPWDDYAGETLKVYGADRATAGQVVWRSLEDQENLHAFLASQGQPDTLEIRGGRFAQKTIILYYTRRSAGRPHSIRLDPGPHGFIPRAPEPIMKQGSEASGAGARPHPRSEGLRGEHPTRAPESPARTVEPAPGRTVAPGAPPARGGEPGPAPTAFEPHAPQAEPTGRHGGATADQRVNCPIDPSRWDCRALCSPGADYEWCR